MNTATVISVVLCWTFEAMRCFDVQYDRLDNLDGYLIFSLHWLAQHSFEFWRFRPV